MSPEVTVRRTLALHYQAIRQALHLPYGVEFRTHLRSMFDRIGVLNTKVIQSSELKQKINLALVESSAVIDLARLQELLSKLPQQNVLKANMQDLQQYFEEYFCAQENSKATPSTQLKLINKINQLQKQAEDLPNNEISQRLQISFNNILSSLCHVKASTQLPQEANLNHG